MKPQYLRASDNPNGCGELPGHIAIIMDGNGRWAKDRGLPRVAGHKAGAESVRKVVEACAEKDIKHLTLFTFSSENWRRPKNEVTLLLELFVSALDNEVKKLHKKNVKFQAVGDISAFDKKIRESIRRAEELTKNNTKLTLTTAVNYGGQWDITEACRRIASAVKSGNLEPEEINRELLEKNVCLSDLPPPDLFIRTGGEQRISNFILWQLAYTELFFTDVLWPDFDKNTFNLALESFVSRQRRFGQTSEQVEAAQNV